MPEEEKIILVNATAQIDDSSSSFSVKEEGTPRLDVTIKFNVKNEQVLQDFLASLKRKIDVINKRDDSMF